jgi:hypothetical protein
MGTNNIDLLIELAVKQSEGMRAKKSEWTEAEDNFLRVNLGYLTDKQIGQYLGRTEIGVHIHWKRDLKLTAPSKRKEILTGHQAARLLGIDGHKITHWCDMGLIPYRLMAGGRKIRLIPRVSFERWVVSPANWVYFNPKQIADPRLRRLCALRADRWGDEWWPANKVARHHKVDTKDVQRLIYRGEIPAVQLTVSRGGRHMDRAWSNWYIRKSDALRAHFVRGRGIQHWQPTARAAAWIKKAHQQGLNIQEIYRSMGQPVTAWTLRQYMVRVGLIKAVKK